MQLDCGRINLFIGKPNVGKSNILEALSLFCAPYVDTNKPFLSQFIRYEKVRNIFFDQLNDYYGVEVSSNIGNIYISYDKHKEEYILSLSQDKYYPKDDKFINELILGVFFDEDGAIINPFETSYKSSVKRYSFKDTNLKKDSSFTSFFLQPPHGRNILKILELSSKLRKKISKLFDEYGLELLVDIQGNNISIQKRIDGIFYQIPYNLTADTLRRLIFHYAAIESNRDSILIFEEPENHSFPPYIRDLAQTIIDAETNQFFITTHSPYLFNTIVENCPPDELAVFITYMENYETKVKKLTDEELAELSNYGVDIFFNLNWFVHGEMDSATS